MAQDSAKLSNISLETPDNIDQYFEILINIINKGIVASSPFQGIITRSKLTFNSECKVAQMKARQLRKRFNCLKTNIA